MKRKIGIIFTLIFLISNSLVLQGQMSTQDEATFEKKLALIAENLKKTIEDGFGTAAQKLKIYDFMLETKPLDQAIADFENFLDDTAVNYNLAMYNAIMDPTTGLLQLKVPPCDPLSLGSGYCGPTIITDDKEVAALNLTEGTVKAIAYEYSRALRDLGFKIINEPEPKGLGLLQKLLELQTQNFELSYKDLPSMIVEDKEWLNKFKVSKSAIFTNVFNAVKEQTKKTMGIYWEETKDDLEKLAAEELDIFISAIQEKTADNPIVKEIQRYRDKLTTVRDTILEQIKKVTDALDTRLAQVKDIAQQAMQSFVNYLKSSLEALSLDSLIKPLQGAAQQALSELTTLTSTLDITTLAQKASSTIENARTQLVGTVTSTVTPAFASLNKALDDISTKFTTPLETLESQIDEKLSSVEKTSLLKDLPEDLKTQTQNDIEEITTAIKDLVTKMGKDLTALANGFIDPAKDASQKAQEVLDSLTKIQPLGSLPEDVASEIQKEIDQFVGDLTQTANDLITQVSGFKDKFSSKFDTSSQNITQIITTSVNQLSDVATNLRDTIVSYIENKVKIVTDTINSIDESISAFEKISGQDFINWTKDYLKDPASFMKNIETSITCKEKDAQGKCILTYADYLSSVLDVTKIPKELESLYNEIKEDLTNALNTFVSSMQTFIDTQKSEVTSLYDDALSTVTQEKESILQIFTNLPKRIEDLVKSITEKITAQSENLLEQLNEVKKNSEAIVEILKNTKNVKDIAARLMENKNDVINIIGTTSKKISDLVKNLESKAKDKASSLITQLNGLKSTTTDLKNKLADTKLLDIPLVSFENLADLGNSIVSITKATQESSKVIAEEFSSLKSASDTVSSLAQSGKKILEDTIFSTVSSLVSQLTDQALELVAGAQTLTGNLTAIQNAVNNATKELGAAAVSLKQEGSSFVATFPSSETAQQVQLKIQEKLPESLAKWIIVNRDDEKISIEPNILSITSETFYELIDQAQERIVRDLIPAIKTMA